MRRRTLRFGVGLVSAAFILSGLAGCAVRDGKEGETAPIWWPSFFYREQPASTTQPFVDSSGASARVTPQRNTAAAVADAIQ